jgi:hypothetical protein
VCLKVKNVIEPHELAVLGRMCIQGEEQVSSSIPEDICVIVANDLLAE